MELVFVWVGLSLLVAMAAGSKNRSGFAWFFISLLLTPIIALLLLIALPANTPPASIATPAATCPYCAEPIQPAAIVCKHCGRDLATEQTDTPQDSTALMQHYGITQEGEKFKYKDYSYTKVGDAIAYAKKDQSEREQYKHL